MSKPIVVLDKGTQIMDATMLTQYKNSPIMRQYMLAFIEEMDLLFSQAEEVYLGRFIEFAVGRQLDIIGIILAEDRNLVITGNFFGFNDENSGTDTPKVEALADEAIPDAGGVFLDESQANYTTTPLGDAQYRQLLLAKAEMSTKDSCGIESIYEAIITLLGKVPAHIKLEVIAMNRVELELSISDTTSQQEQVIQYFSKYMLPLGTALTISRI